MSAPARTISPELKALLREAGPNLDTLPERLALARTAGMATPSSWS